MGLSNIKTTMKHLAAYCLLVLGGNASPSAEDVEKLMKEVGVKVDKEALGTMIEKVGAAPVQTHISNGAAKMGSVGGGGGAGAAPAQAEEATEEDKKKDDSDDDVDMGGMGGLFGDDDY